MSDHIRVFLTQETSVLYLAFPDKTIKYHYDVLIIPFLLMRSFFA